MHTRDININPQTVANSGEISLSISENIITVCRLIDNYGGQRNIEQSMSSYSVSFISVDGPIPVNAWPSADIVVTDPIP